MNLVQYFLAFMLYSIIGWAYETALYTVQEGRYISSGFLKGPYCPIYGNGAVSLRYEFKLTTFCEVDQVHNSHLPTLDLRAMMIMGAFAAGYLKVADRAPKVTSLAADTSLYDAAEVHLVLTLTVDRKDFLPETLVEIMQTLNTRFVDKKEEST